MPDDQQIQLWLNDLQLWIGEHVFNMPNLIQAAAILTVLFAAKYLAKRIDAHLSAQEVLPIWLEQARERLASLMPP